MGGHRDARLVTLGHTLDVAACAQTAKEVARQQVGGRDRRDQQGEQEEGEADQRDGGTQKRATNPKKKRPGIHSVE
jgi:hypothetical protein